MEAEHIASSKVAKKAIWIRNFVSKFGVVPCVSNPMDLHSNNSGIIA
jgi:hypothetical protein